jgi:hypothetical protein
LLWKAINKRLKEFFSFSLTMIWFELFCVCIKI